MMLFLVTKPIEVKRLKEALNKARIIWLIAFLYSI
jgi:hypothetical protein